MKASIALVLLGAGLAASGPVFAWQSIDDPAKDGQCAFMQVFDTPGQTTFVVSQNQTQFDNGDSVSIIIYNKNWSLQDGEHLGETISIGADHIKIAVQEPAVVDNGLGLTVSHDHLKSFAESNPQLVVVRKGDQAIARLNFSNFSNVWAYFENCHDAKVAAKIGREGNGDIPLNPFGGRGR